MTLFSLLTAAAVGILVMATATSACDRSLPLPRDCYEVYGDKGCTREGVYTIDPHCPDQKPFKVYCKEGYTVFQRRMNGEVDFDRSWNDYADGFGEVSWEHWLGLNKTSCLTSRKPKTQLRIEMVDFSGVQKYAQYSFFTVGSAASDYVLHIAGYTGTAGDSILFSNPEHGQYLNGSPFGTAERSDCVRRFSPWWYNNCFTSMLNGHYYQDASPTWQGIHWYTFTGPSRSLKFVEMKLI